MPTLQRITTKYIESEDRIRLTAITESDEALTLWATQRMLLRLLVHLLRWLQQDPSRAAASFPADPQTESALQGFAQQSAAVDIKKQSPVLAGSDSQAWLVHEIDAKHNDEVVLLVFKCVDAQQAELRLTMQQLRQWLAILHTNWKKADWPMAVWPTWMDEDSATAAERSDSAVH